MNEKDSALQNELLEKYPFLKIRKGSADHASFDVPADKALEFAFALRDRENFASINDVSGCDWGVSAFPRFSVIWHVYNFEKKQFVRMNVFCENNENPRVPSLCEVWAGCNWQEREVFDLLGIEFENHPNLKKILMWDEYPFHPLRKDFPLAGKETSHPDEDTVAQTGVKVLPAPQNGGPFLASGGTTLKTSEPSALDQEWKEGARKRDFENE